jgi:hypothetical protein
MTRKGAGWLTPATPRPLVQQLVRSSGIQADAGVAAAIVPAAIRVLRCIYYLSIHVELPVSNLGHTDDAAVDALGSAVSLAAGLQQVHEPILVHGLERGERRPRRRGHTWHVASEEQSDAARRAKLANAPGASGIVGDPPDDDASERVVRAVPCARDP